MPPLECLQSNREFFGQHLSPTNFCASFRNGTNVCLSDSGGSMTFKEYGIYHIRGIASVAPAEQILTANTNNSIEYALFTDVAQYFPWIREFYSEEKLRCEEFGEKSDWECHVDLTNAQKECKMVFDVMSDTTVTVLRVNGHMDFVPDISDAAGKFINLAGLHLHDFKGNVEDRATLSNFRKIKDLDLDSNVISQLAPDTFDDLIYLTRLSITSNWLEELHADTFKGLPDLTVLNLQHNHLETLPANIFHKNQKLERIVLNYNGLKELKADTFKRLLNLNFLELGFNQFKTLPGNIFQNNRKLVEIYLSYNELKEVHADIFKGLCNLQTLRIGANQFETLPANIFHSNQKLEKIFLYQNNLKKFNADDFRGPHNLPSLQFLFKFL